VLIKRPIKFGGFPTPTNTRNGGCNGFLKNLQRDNELTGLLGAYGV